MIRFRFKGFSDRANRNLSPPRRTPLRATPPIGRPAKVTQAKLLPRTACASGDMTQFLSRLHPMKTRILATVVVALGVLGAIFGYKEMQTRAASAALAARKPVPAAVTSAKTARQRWAMTLGSVGT